MTNQPQEIAALLRQVRNRWRLLMVLRASTLAGAAAALVLGLALVAHRLLDPQGIALIALWALAIAAAVACVATVVPSIRRVPRDPQLARFIEERCPELEDVLATVIGGDLTGSNPMAAAVADEAARRIQAIDRDRVISGVAVRKAAVLSAAATLALVLLGALMAGPAGGAMRLAAVYLFPERLALAVIPGDVKVRAGDPLRVVATISGSAAVVPMLKTGDGTETLMQAGPDGFAVEFERVEEDFQYVVTAAGTASPEYSVTVIRPPRVQRIDLRYQYPAAFRMAPRQEEDGGDIYGPAGTRVHVTVHVDKPVTRAALNITGGSPIALAQAGETLQGVLVIADDGSYRVALADADGLNNPGDTEYFIRTLQDSPPSVHIVRPASDRQVTPVEEVSIEAKADDDFGVAALDLVYTVGTGAEKVVPFDREGEPTAVSGRRTVYLEDLRVKPGDFVAYYARARDVSRGRRSTEARSDIFFLEVTPFEEEFVASQSQGSGSGGDEETLEDLIQQQKDIVTATWNLDRRSREAGGRSDDDIRAVGRAQRDVRTRAMATLAQMRRAADLRRRNTIGGRGAVAAGPDLMIEAIARAVEAMERARQQLDALKTADALPPEMDALNELLRAQAEVRRREVQQQANGQGGRGANRAQQDISSLFDRELAKQQQTNYETPGRPQTGDNQPEEDDALEKIQELARRQDALNKSQQELAKNREATSAEELKRQLERLTREQSELRREAEELARQLQQQGQQGSQSNQGRQNQGQQAQGQQSQGQQSGQSQQGQGRGQGRGQSRPGEQAGQGGQGERQQASRELQQISEDMQGAASELRRDNPGEASARGSRAAERLRDLEQRMRSAQPDDRRRALGELQLESRQLADAQRRLTGEAGARGGTDPADRARRQAAEQERLADRTERLEEAVKQLAGASQGADARERNALNEALRELEQQRPSQRMRTAARAGQTGAGPAGTPAGGLPPSREASADRRSLGGGGQASGEQIARTLDRVGDRLGAAGGQSEDSQRLTEELSRIRELREDLAQLDRQLEQLREQTGERGGAGRGRANEPGRGAEGGGVQNGDIQTQWQDARELLGELQRENRLESLAREADGFNPGRSAPGTEAWKQDFTKWDELKVQVAAALERAEQTAADRLRDQQATDRLNAGATQAVPEAYRRLVEKYYRALAR